MRSAAQETPRFDYIDAVRGLAFLGVFVAHVSAVVGQFPGKSMLEDSGYGVQLFFLASAVTLCYSMTYRRRSEPRPVLSFYLRRLFRIAPLFWVAIVMYWAVPALHTHWLSEWAPGGVHPSYFLLNAGFLHGWLPNAFNSIVPGGWSIAVEMNFYVFFPLLFRWLGRSLKASMGWMITSILLLNIFNHLVLARVRHVVYPGTSDTVWQFFSHMWLPAQLPVFLIGFVLFQLLKNDAVQQAMRDRYWALCTFVFSSMLILTILTGRDRGFIPGYVIVSVGLAGCILSISGNAIPMMTNRFLRFVGKISYSGYLLHFAAIDLGLWLLRLAHVRSAMLPESASPLQSLALLGELGILSLALTILLATVSSRLVENRGIALGRIVVNRLAAAKEGARQPRAIGAEETSEVRGLVGA